MASGLIMTENSNRETPPRAIFGSLSITCFGSCVLLALFGPTSDGEAVGIGNTLKNFTFASVLALIGLGFAVVSLFKHERPGWPAWVGFFFCLVPVI